MLVDIFIPGNQLHHAEQGQKVIAQIVDWPKGVKNPIGKITRVLGWPGENDVEMNSILSEFGFPLDFPKRVEEDAAAIPETISREEIARRKDFRKVTTFTIDPEDAKDFDDALSIRKTARIPGRSACTSLMYHIMSDPIHSWIRKRMAAPHRFI
jgi:ribonuclease R